MATVYTHFFDALTGESQEMRVTEGRVRERGAQVSRDGASDVVDLQGAWVLPAFVDAHCHILPTGLDLQKLHLGPASSPADVLDLLRDRHREQPDGWLMAVHYDQNRYPGGRHMTRDDLDTISPTRPILLRHSNGHASVANSAALAAAGVDESTPNPSGGEYVRDASGRLNGVLLEEAHEIVTGSAPAPTEEEMVEAILLAGAKMREFGIGCASDMMTGRFDLRKELNAYRIASERGCQIATRLYVQWRDIFGRRAMPEGELRELMASLDAGPINGTRVAGAKIFADGAIGSATAAIYGRYDSQPIDPAAPRPPTVKRYGHDVQGSGESEVSGQLCYRPERLHDMVRIADEAGWSIAIHAIGDYATDLVMDAYEKTSDPKRHRIEHAMLLSDAQIERLAALGCSVTFQPEFLLRFGHAYRAQLGEEQAAHLKRTRSVLDAGIPLSFNSDRPIVGGNPWDGILTAVAREGFDPAERCTREEAIAAYTVAGSRVNGDGEAYGTLAVGSYADFQTYAENPMTGDSPQVLAR